MELRNRCRRAYVALIAAASLLLIVSVRFSPVSATSVAPLPNTIGAQRTAVILINFLDNTSQPWTLSQVQNAFSSASSFFLENSYGQTWLATDVYGWYTLPITQSSGTCGTIAEYANSGATAAGVNLSAYAHWVYLFSSATSPCNGDSAQVGTLPSEAWLNQEIDVASITHEMGHNLGLDHSHGLYCGNASIGTIGTTCSALEYGDVIDTMGDGTGDYNAFQKERLGWLNYGASPPITTVITSGIYDIDVYETTSTSPKALKIYQGLDPANGLRRYYYVEYRQALGFDSSISSLTQQNFTNGVAVHWGTPGDLNSSYLLDMTPNSSYYYDLNDAALVPGQTFSDPNAGVTITALSATSTGASVQITLTNTSRTATPTPTSTATPKPTATATPTPTKKSKR